MIRIIRQALAASFLGVLVGTMVLGPLPALAQSTPATLLPNAVQQYIDDAGVPVANGKVYYYVPNSPGTLKPVWEDANKTVQQANPVLLDAAGRPQPAGQTYGDGVYRQKVVDQDGMTIWDNVTSSTGGSGGGGTPTPVAGDGLPVGTILPWSGFVAPPNYQFAGGQEVLRSAFPELEAAITTKVGVVCVVGSNILSGIADTTQITVGAVVEATCVPPNVTVTNKTANSLTLSLPAGASTNVVAQIFPYGNGNGTTTFNVPDLSGRAPVGRNNMSATPYAGLTAQYFGVNPNGIGARGGGQSHVLLQAELPSYSPLFNGTAGPVSVLSLSTKVVVASSFGGVTAGPGSDGDVLSGTGIGNLISEGTFTPDGTIDPLGTDTPFSLVQPSLTLNYIVKVTPDASSTSFYGVASIGGMQGVINCGPNLNCSGNTIDAVPTPPSGVTSIDGMTGVLTCGTGMSCTGGVISAAGSGGSYNVTSYGAVCDGVTDDTGAINTAIASVPAGSTLIFPSTVCLIASFTNPSRPYSILVNKSLHISFPNGGGLTTTVDAMLINIKSSRVTIDGAAGAILTGTASGTTTYSSWGIGIAMNDALGTTTRYSNITIKGLRIFYFRSTALQLSFCDYCTIENVQIYEARYAGIMCVSCQNSTIYANSVQNIWSSDGPAVPPVNRADHYGIAVTSWIPTLSPSENVVVSGNIVNNVPAWECYDTHHGRSISFVNNIGRNCAIGMSAGSDTNISMGGVVIANNRFTCIGPGQPVYSGQSPGTSLGNVGIRVVGVAALVATEITIKGNVLSNCGSSDSVTIGTLGAIGVAYINGLSMEGNTMYLSRQRGISVLANVSGSIQNNWVGLRSDFIGSTPRVIDILDSGNVLNMGGLTAVCSGCEGYYVAAQSGGYVGISRSNVINGVGTLYAGGTSSNRVDLGATAP